MPAKKCVIVIDPELPVGIIANTAAVLSLSLGRLHPETIGHDLLDQAGRHRHGITTKPIPVLKGSREQLCRMRELVQKHEPELTVIDLTSATRHTRSYGEYAVALAETPVTHLEYLGLALYGPEKMVNQHTGSLGLLR